MNLLFSKKISTNEALILPFGVKSARIRCDPTATIEGIGICNTATINGKSPCKFRNLSSIDTTIQIMVEKIGGIPDPNYFSDEPTVIPEIIQHESEEQEVNNDAV